MSAVKLMVSAVALVMASAAHAGLVGKGFSTFYAHPDITTAYSGASVSPSTFTVGAGNETLFDVEGVTQISVDFSDNSLALLLTTSLLAPTWNSTSFNGLVFDLISGGPLDIVAAAVDPTTTMTGFDASRVSFDSGRIAINWSGLSYVDGTKVIVNFTNAVPEPPSWLMVVGALALLGGHRSIRRRQQQPVHVPPAA